MIDTAALHAGIQRSWTTQDWEAWRASCGPTYTFVAGVGSDGTGMGAPRDREATMAWNLAHFVAFADYEEEILHLCAGPSSSVAEHRATATFGGPLDLGGIVLPPNGRQVEFRYAKVLEYDATGRVTADRQYLDVQALAAQLGRPPI